VGEAEEDLRATGNAEAAAEAEVVFLAVPWSAAESIVSSLGDLGDRVLVDCTNPLVQGGGGLDQPGGRSGAERIADAVGSARVVKAFNTTGSANMLDPDFGDLRPILPLCSDDAEARGIVATLAAEIGFEPLDCGPLSMAAALEQLALLWITLAYRQRLGPEIAFALLRR
jgi:predicted dinucleotide-binding enzyme